MWEWLWNQAVSGAWKGFEQHDRKSPNCLKQTISRSLVLEDAASAGTKGSEEDVLRSWRRTGPCYVVAETW